MNYSYIIFHIRYIRKQKMNNQIKFSLNFLIKVNNIKNYYFFINYT